MSDTDDEPLLPMHRYSVKVINEMVMRTEDLELLAAWLEEEKLGARRRSALHRIYHRLNILRSRQDHMELDKICVKATKAPWPPRDC